MERNLLQKLNIPPECRFILKVYGRPKYDACGEPKISNLFTGWDFYLDESISCYAF